MNKGEEGLEDKPYTPAPAPPANHSDESLEMGLRVGGKADSAAKAGLRLGLLGSLFLALCGLVQGNS